ncbi:MAG TPA: hypothetical protein VKY19_02415 [Ktedonosporobacter sp.]|jgi:hypothetical protein|nr:hypothetical protein [Ktedonosporobacter sp.]
MYQQYQRLTATLWAYLSLLLRRRWIRYSVILGSTLFILILIALALPHLNLVAQVLPRDPDPPWPVLIS